jgi:hypothetical protein
MAMNLHIPQNPEIFLTDKLLASQEESCSMESHTSSGIKCGYYLEFKDIKELRQQSLQCTPAVLELQRKVLPCSYRLGGVTTNRRRTLTYIIFKVSSHTMQYYDVSQL